MSTPTAHGDIIHLQEAPLFPPSLHLQSVQHVSLSVCHMHRPCPCLLLAVDHWWCSDVSKHYKFTLPSLSHAWFFFFLSAGGTVFKSTSEMK